MKRIRWKLIDNWWPDGKQHRGSVRAARAGACNACGQCCALIVTCVDLEYFREQNYAWRVWASSHGVVPGPEQKRMMQDYQFFLKYWVRVSRVKAAERGFVSGIENANFIYHCLALTKDGKCSVHDGFRPMLCEDHPFYEGWKFKGKGKKKFEPNVRLGCGFADRRFK